MYVKLYAAVWGLLLLVAAALAVTGNFSLTMAIIYGFISFGMVFLGMMSVLPSIASTPEGRAALCESKAQKGQDEHTISEDVRHSVYDWSFPKGVEISPPKHH